MGRKRLPEKEVKKSISVSLPSWMIEELKKRGNVSNTIESLVAKFLKKSKE